MSEETKPQMPTDREVLPIPNEAYAGPVLYDANDPAAVFPPIQEIRPPKGAPNVLVVLIDDAGFGASSAFGGPVSTPVAERLAANGLKYTRFPTTALCSPTRAALRCVRLADQRVGPAVRGDRRARRGEDVEAKRPARPRAGSIPRPRPGFRHPPR